MGAKMEISESVMMKDPVSGRLCKVFMTEEEVRLVLNVGLHTLIQKGLMSIEIGEHPNTEKLQ